MSAGALFYNPVYSVAFQNLTLSGGGVDIGCGSVICSVATTNSITFTNVMFTNMNANTAAIVVNQTPGALTNVTFDGYSSSSTGLVSITNANWYLTNVTFMNGVSSATSGFMPTLYPSALSVTSSGSSNVQLTLAGDLNFINHTDPYSTQLVLFQVTGTGSFNVVENASNPANLNFVDFKSVGIQVVMASNKQFSMAVNKVNASITDSLASSLTWCSPITVPNTATSDACPFLFGVTSTMSTSIVQGQVVISASSVNTTGVSGFVAYQLDTFNVTTGDFNATQSYNAYSLGIYNVKNFNQIANNLNITQSQWADLVVYNDAAYTPGNGSMASFQVTHDCVFQESGFGASGVPSWLLSPITISSANAQMTCGTFQAVNATSANFASTAGGALQVTNGGNFSLSTTTGSIYFANNEAQRMGGAVYVGESPYTGFPFLNYAMASMPCNLILSSSTSISFINNSVDLATSLVAGGGSWSAGGAIAVAGLGWASLSTSNAVTGQIVFSGNALTASSGASYPSTLAGGAIYVGMGDYSASAAGTLLVMSSAGVVLHGNQVLTGNSAMGGAVHVENNGYLTLNTTGIGSEVSFTQNSAFVSGLSTNVASMAGGGAMSILTYGSVNVAAPIVTFNWNAITQALSPTIPCLGGAVLVNAATLHILSSNPVNFTANNVDPGLTAGQGGALAATGSTFTISPNATFRANSAYYGGAIYVDFSTFSPLTTSSFINNYAVGGGCWINPSTSFCSSLANATSQLSGNYYSGSSFTGTACASYDNYCGVMPPATTPLGSNATDTPPVFANSTGPAPSFTPFPSTTITYCTSTTPIPLGAPSGTTCVDGMWVMNSTSLTGTTSTITGSMNTTCSMNMTDGTYMNVTGDVTVSGSLSMTNGTTMTVGGSTSINGSLAMVSSYMNVTANALINGDMALNASTMTIIGTSTIYGNMNMYGSSTTVSASSTIDGSLSMSGSSMNISAGATITGAMAMTSSSMSIAGPSTINGIVQLQSSAINVSSTATFNGGMAMSFSAMSLYGTSTIYGNVQLSGSTMNATAMTTIVGDLALQRSAVSVSADASFNGNMDMQASQMTISASASINGDMAMASSQVTVAAGASINGLLNMTSSSSMSVTSGASINGSLHSSGSGNLQFAGVVQIYESVMLTDASEMKIENGSLVIGGTASLQDASLSLLASDSIISGSLVGSGTAKFNLAASGSVQIDGDFDFSTTSTITFSVDLSSTTKRGSKGNHSAVNVTHSANTPSTVYASMSSNDTSTLNNGGNVTVRLIEAQSLTGNVTVVPIFTSSGCQTLNTQTSQEQDPTNGRTTLVALFSLDSSGCGGPSSPSASAGTWQIIVGATVGGVAGLVIIALLLAMFSKRFRSALLPFRESAAVRAANLNRRVTQASIMQQRPVQAEEPVQEPSGDEESAQEQSDESSSAEESEEDDSDSSEQSSDEESD